MALSSAGFGFADRGVDAFALVGLEAFTLEGLPFELEALTLEGLELEGLPFTCRDDGGGVLRGEGDALWLDDGLRFAALIGFLVVAVFGAMRCSLRVPSLSVSVSVGNFSFLAIPPQNRRRQQTLTICFIYFSPPGQKKQV